MRQQIVDHPDGTFDLHLSCDFCGKPVVTSGPSGMSCEDRCADTWVRWDRLGRMRVLSDEQQAERDALTSRLFRPDGSPKHAGPPEPPPTGRQATPRGAR